MAAKTTTQAGNRETGSTWTGGAAPVAGDTETYSHSVTVTANGEAGSSPSTGGTEAAAFAFVGGKTLTINPSVAFTLKGDLGAKADYLLVNSIVIGAGASLIWLPPSGQQYKVAMTETVHWSCNGTSGSPVVISTDKNLGGLAAYFDDGAISRNGGITIATYTHFVDMGTATKFGIYTLARQATYHAQPISITDCEFTRSSYRFSQESNFDQNYTFQRNTFRDSVKAAYGDASYVAVFNTGNSPSTATWLIDSNSFDGIVHFPSYKPGLSCTNNVFREAFFLSGSPRWSSDDDFNGNLLSWGLTSNDTAFNCIGGSSRDCIFISVWSGDTNQHGSSVQNTADDVVLTGLVFWAAYNSGSGDCIFPQGGSHTLTVRESLVLPSGGNGNTTGNLISVEASGSAVIQHALHNTMCATNGECGLMRQNHLGGSFAGQIGSCLSNLLVSYGTTTGCKAISSSDGSTDGAVNAVTDAGYQGFYNPTLNQTCKYNTTTVQSTVTGYNRVRISANTPFPNSQVGHDDVVVDSDPIVDSTYTPNDWGLENGGTGDVDDTLDILFEDPSLIIAAGETAIIPRLRAKWSVTGAAGLLLKDAAHEGAGYTIGMGEYVAVGGGRRGMNNRTLRPY